MSNEVIEAIKIDGLRARNLSVQHGCLAEMQQQQ